MEKNTKVLSQRKLLGVAGLGWMFDALDVGMLSFIIVALRQESVSYTHLTLPTILLV